MGLMKEREFKVSEIFYSFQGEGLYTGYPAIFIRFFGCNLQCNFGGKTETQYIDTLDEFVVPSRGCDSGYAWLPSMQHLATGMTINEIVDKVVNLLPADSNSDIAIVYTGGEPMLKQEAIYLIHEALSTHPSTQNRIITEIVETNGTLKPFRILDRLDIHYSISPKLMTVTNESKGVNYDSICDIINSTSDSNFILKFVMDNRDASWEELDEVISVIEKRCFGDIRNYVYIMPMGADFRGQTSDEVESIVHRALNKGYKISLRTHVYVFKNKIGS